MTHHEVRENIFIKKKRKILMYIIHILYAACAQRRLGTKLQR